MRKIARLRSIFSSSKVEKNPSQQSRIRQGQSLDIKKEGLLFSSSQLSKQLFQKIAFGFGFGSLEMRKERQNRVQWFPQRLQDLNRIGSTISQVVDQGQLGQVDAYTRRRNEIAQGSRDYKVGTKIPDIKYTAEQTKLWCYVYQKLSKLHKAGMCKKYNDQMKIMNEIFRMDQRIPQLNQLSQYLVQKTGFRLKPVNGLMSQREFLNSLAFKYFCSTQYIRNAKNPDISYEPDIIHEVIGHMAMLADPQVAAISHKLGLLSLGASDQVITQLGTLYWFTIEFGVCKQGDSLRGYGAGLASSITQIQNMMSGKARIEKLNTSKDCRQVYSDQSVQPVYKVTEDFNHCVRDLEKFGEQIAQPFKVFYNQNTKEIQFEGNSKDEEN